MPQPKLCYHWKFTFQLHPTAAVKRHMCVEDTKVVHKSQVHLYGLQYIFIALQRRTYVSYYFFFQAEIKSYHEAFLIAVFLSAEIFYLIFEELDLIWNISEKTGNLNTYLTSSFLSCCIQTQIVSMTFNVSPLCVMEEGSKIVCLNLVLLISLWSFYKFVSIIATFYASSKKDVYRLRNTRLRHVFDIVFSITYVNPCLLFFIHPWSCNLFFEWNIKSIYYSLSLLGTPIDFNANWNFFFLFTVVWFTVWFQ